MMERDDDILKTGTFDWLIVFIYLAMVIWGWLAIYSADFNPVHPEIYSLDQSYGRQLLWIGASMVIALVVLLLDHRVYPAFAYIIYGIIILALVSVFFLVSKRTAGALSWFEIGSFKFQPSEFAKFATALAIAKYLSAYGISFKDRKTQVICFALFLVPMALVLAQNDTGSALVFSAFILALYREGLSGFLLFTGVYAALLFLLAILVDNIVLVAVLSCIALLIILFVRKNRGLVFTVIGFLVLSLGVIFSVDYVYNNVLQPHQHQRIEVMLGRVDDIKGVGYNVYQSKVAIGSGGIYGKGFLQGTQTKLHFVPEQSTDFIFCTVGEEYGFVGSAGLVILYVSFLIRLIQIAERQRSRFNRIYAYCVASIFFIHFAINLGMTVGIFPVVGIPLPFFSYGGSSLLGFTIMLFILIRLDANRRNEVKRAFEI
ncbi:MAG TPA: rod shape-determining protein RodA [Bacteroidia bacterium]|nr:rod shape-determining protein RodA [Bacteroidia bacterium]